MKKVIHNSIALICVFAMCLTFSAQVVLAVESPPIVEDFYVELKLTDINDRLSENSVAASQKNLEKIISDTKILGRIGVLFQEENVEEITIDNNGGISYLVSIGNYKNLISIDSASDNTEITFRQDGITNIMNFYNDGSIYVDGNLVNAHKDADIERVAASQQEIWDTYPWAGDPSDYIYYQNTVRENEIQLQNSIQNFTISAFVSTVALITGLDEFVSFGLGILTGVYTSFVRRYPNSNKLSYKADIYYMADGNSYVPGLGFFSQYEYTFYSLINCAGGSHSETWYRYLSL